MGFFTNSKGQVVNTGDSGNSGEIVQRNHDDHIIQARKKTREALDTWTGDERGAFITFGNEGQKSFAKSGGNGNRDLSEPYDRLVDRHLAKIKMADHGIIITPTSKGKEMGQSYRRAAALLKNDPERRRD